MADNTNRVTKIGPHLIIVDDGVFVTKFGAYAEILGEDVRVTSSGGIAEMQGGAVRVTSSGAIAEILYSPVSAMSTYAAAKTGNRAYHTRLPEEVSGYAFDPKWSWWSVIKGKWSRNEIHNGSFEDSNHHLSTFAGWTSHGRNNTDEAGAAFGQYTYKGVAPALTLCEWTYDHDTGVGVLTDLGPYTFSMWIYSTADNYEYQVQIIDAAGPTTFARNSWHLDAGWNRISISWVNLSTKWIKIRMLCDAGNSSANTIYIDGLQLEPLRYPTTYFDGDMLGWDDPYPDYSYRWEGIPHQSDSIRSETTNSGGEIISLSDSVGLLTTAILGLGMHPVDLQTIELDSGKEILVDSRAQPRDFTIVGRIYGCNWSKLSERRNEIIKLLNPQNNAKREPIILRYQPTNTDGRLYGIPLDIKCAYKEGLGGNYATLYQENVPIQMRASEPGVFEEITMSKVTTGVTTLVDNGIIYRDKDYLYQQFGTGTTNGPIRDVSWAVDLINDRFPIVGGFFSQLAGFAVNNAAKWNPIVNQWQQVVAGDYLNNTVYGMAGNSFVTIFAGSFTDSNLAAGPFRKVAHWQASAPTVWNETGDGLTGGDAYVLSFEEAGLGLYVGGDFTDNGASTNPDLLNIAYLADVVGGGNWTNLRGGTNGRVYDILNLNDGNVIVAGDFTAVYTATGAASPLAASYIAHWSENDGQWSNKFYTNGAEQGFDARVTSIVLGDDGLLYAAGLFTQDDNSTYDLRGFARWNGSAWEEVLDLESYLNGGGGTHEPRLRKDSRGVIWITTDEAVGMTVPHIGLCWMFGWKDGVIYPPPYKHEDYTGLANPGIECLRFGSHNEMFLGKLDTDGNDMLVPDRVEIDYQGTFETNVNVLGQGEFEPSFIEFPTIGLGGIFFGERGQTVIASFWEWLHIRPDQPRHRVFTNSRHTLLNHLNLPATTFSKMKLLPNQTNYVSVFFPEPGVGFQVHLWWQNRYSSIDPGAI
jgi:hypothetical protein